MNDRERMLCDAELTSEFVFAWRVCVAHDTSALGAATVLGAASTTVVAEHRAANARRVKALRAHCTSEMRAQMRELERSGTVEWRLVNGVVASDPWSCRVTVVEWSRSTAGVVAFHRWSGRV